MFLDHIAGNIRFYSIIVIAAFILLAAALVTMYILFRKIRKRETDQRKEYGEKLKESDEIFKQAVENIDEVFWIGSYEWKEIYYVSPAYEKVWGRSCESLYADPFSWFNSVLEEDKDEVLANIPERITDAEIVCFPEYRIRHDDGTILWISARAYPIKNENGEIYRYVEIAENITERKKIEDKFQQIHKMEAIGTFASGIAHDFNNILSPIIGYSEMLKEEKFIDENAAKKIDIILQSAIRARDLVKQILSYSRKENQEAEPVYLPKIIEEVLNLTRAIIPKTINIETDICPDCGTVMVNPAKIHQVIMNIISNANHAMSEEGGNLKISLKPIELHNTELAFPDLYPGKYAEIIISDSGTGIKKELLGKVFDPYFTTKEKNKGTGLGLFVVRGIVKSFHGSINIYSEEGQGTNVNIYLPVMKDDSQKEDSGTGDSLASRGSERILLVDDEDNIVSMEKEMLEGLGYKVTVKTDSIDALNEFKKAPAYFDLVITDMTMPKLTGYELSKKLKKLRRGIPVIICTGYSERLNNQEYTEYFDGFVMKPVMKKELSDLIRKVLDNSPHLV